MKEEFSYTGIALCWFLKKDFSFFFWLLHKINIKRETWFININRKLKSNFSFSLSLTSHFYNLSNLLSFNFTLMYAYEDNDYYYWLLFFWYKSQAKNWNQISTKKIKNLVFWLYCLGTTNLFFFFFFFFYSFQSDSQL